MPAVRVIEAVDVLKDAGFGLATGFPRPAPEQLGLHGWTCPYQTGHSAWLDNWLAMNSRGDLMRKPECGWMLL